MANFLTRVFGSRNQRLLRQYAKDVDRINALEADMQALSDDALAAKTDEFRARVEKGETLDDLLVEAFATVREAASSSSLSASSSGSSALISSTILARRLM